MSQVAVQSRIRQVSGTRWWRRHPGAIAQQQCTASGRVSEYALRLLPREVSARRVVQARGTGNACALCTGLDFATAGLQDATGVRLLRLLHSLPARLTGSSRPWAAAAAAAAAMGPRSPEVAASLARERSLRVSAESEAAAQAQIEESIQTQLAEVQAAIDMRQCRLRSTPRRLCVRSRTL